MPPPLAQARALLDAGKLDQARSLLMRALQSSPKDPEANDLMRALCLAQNNIPQALYYAERTVAAAPDHPAALADYGALLAAVGQNNDALAILQKALALDPQSRQGHFAYVATLFTLGRVADAEAAARRALEHLGDDHDLNMKLAACLLNLGQADQAAQLLSQALFQRPDDLTLAESLCTILNYDHTAEPRRVFEAHRNFGRLVEQQPGPAPFTHPPHPAAASRAIRPERLRVGILSPDLRLHSVGFFAEPILQHLDRARFDLFVYDTAPRPAHPDAMTKRMQAYQPMTWRPAASLPPQQLAAGIHQDKLDILIELSGLTAGNRMAALHLKPAPVQLTYLGYPNTTGVKALDARIVDTLTDPAIGTPPADALATERLLRLDPCFLCFRPPPDAPAVAPLPMLANASTTAPALPAPITFGSFNALTKLNDATLALWSRVLAACPGSRLLLKSREIDAPDVRAHLLARCARAGLTPDRVEILPPARTIADHLACYARLDTALDTFPYHGTTTTCDALWMGVPVLSLQGPTHASRVGRSLLSAVGLPDWSADSEPAIIAKAQSAAANPPALATLRATLRGQVAASPLCDAPTFARRFEAILDQAWTTPPPR